MKHLITLDRGIHHIVNMRILAVLITLISISILLGTDCANSKNSKETPVYGYKIINSYPHDTNAFTQGLVFDNGKLYESTGLNNRSTLREVNIETGEVLKVRKLNARYFAEGIAAVNNKIIQLTWRSNTGFVYNKNTFDQIKSFTYTTQGWGITYDGRHLIMSDGSANLYFHDPDTYEQVGKLEVYDNNGPVSKLNELEFINGEIYANIWDSYRIARINPTTGSVTAWIDLTGILSNEERAGREDVLNGIAYDKQNDRLFVTGKLWPKLFEIKIIPGK